MVFLLLLALIPLAAVFLLKLLILAGAWTLESLTEPLYAITASVVFAVVLAIGVWSLVTSTRPTTGNLGRSGAPSSGEATAYCNACGKMIWANAVTCHFCHAPTSDALRRFRALF
jgi:hypothetical protein